jgi:hypothetical protein
MYMNYKTVLLRHFSVPIGYTSNSNLIKNISKDFRTESNKLMVKCTWKDRGPRTVRQARTESSFYSFV